MVVGVIYILIYLVGVVAGYFLLGYFNHLIGKYSTEDLAITVFSWVLVVALIISIIGVLLENKLKDPIEFFKKKDKPKL